MNKNANLATRISIIIPVLNEEEGIEACLRQLQPLRELGMEVIVVDGGSTDSTVALSEPAADILISADPGRARQMNAGAALAQGNILFFLHSDTCLPSASKLVAAISALPSGFGWGFCNVALSGNSWWAAVIAFFMNCRARLTGVATGDQGLFVEADVFKSVGGFADIPLMEDIALSKTLKSKVGKPCNPGFILITSSRRWQKKGVMTTVLLMWWLRLLYVVGVSPQRLHSIYYSNNKSSP